MLLCMRINDHWIFMGVPVEPSYATFSVLPLCARTLKQRQKSHTKSVSWPINGLDHDVIGILTVILDLWGHHLIRVMALVHRIA